MKVKFSIPFNGGLALVKEALSSGQVGEGYFVLPGSRRVFDRETGSKANLLKTAASVRSKVDGQNE